MRSLRFLYLALLCLCALGAEADVIVSIDLDRDTPGIQSVLAATPGQAINAAVVLQLTNSSNLTGYDFSVRFRTDELDLGAASFTLFEIDKNNNIISTSLAGRPTPPPVWNLGFPPPNPSTGSMTPLTLPSLTVITDDAGVVDPVVGAAGAFQDIDAGALNASEITFAGINVPIYEFNLVAASPTGDASIIDVYPVVGPNSFLFGSSPVTPVFAIGASVIPSAVPEPSTWAVAGFGALYIGRRNRRRRKHSSADTAA